MEKYKFASQQKLRFQTSRGLLSVEQLWELSLTDLDTLAVSLEEQKKESGKKSFLVENTSENKVISIMFDIVLDVLTTKLEESKAAKEALEAKQFNQKIISLIAEKEDSSLKEKSIEELREMLK